MLRQAILLILMRLIPDPKRHKCGRVEYIMEVIFNDAIEIVLYLFGASLNRLQHDAILP